ncbi:MAG: hypothetical protein ACI4J0_08175 [Huintestinicola sp.]|uniref:hypothetical protein n=1 Tax=Huintestinicola sp. TaxID=2981661 RepID=UPI002A904B79|nr:hypothetical protein [Oscillospiraceae bacterium]
MMYPFLTLDDETEITHSELLPSGKVKVYIEKPDEKDCFHHMICYLPDYSIDDVYGFSNDEVDKYMNIVRSTAHLIMEFAEEGGFERASGL